MAIDALAALKEWRAQAAEEGLIRPDEFDDERLITLTRGLLNPGQLEPARRRLGLGDRAESVFTSAWKHLAVQSHQGLTVASVPSELQPVFGLTLADAARIQSEGSAPVAAGAGAGESSAVDEVEDHSWGRYEGATPPRRGNLAVSIDGNEAKVSWHPVGSDPVKLYRVVFRDDYPPFDPDNGRTVIATTATHASVSPPNHFGVRYVTVWQHSGADEDAARAAEPTCIADKEIVAVPHDIRILQDGDRAICQWELPAKAIEDHVLKYVEILRFDAADYEAGAADSFGGVRVAGTTPNFGGFVDGDIQPGGSYVYRVSVHAQSDLDEVVGEPVYVRFAMETPLEPVLDLQVTDADEGSADSLDVDLTWSAPPSGKVVIYRTQQPPQAGFDREPITIEALEQIGLPAAARLPNPIDFTDDGHRTMRRVGRPSSWHMVFFTPVTLTDRDARIGRTVNGEPETQPPTNFTIVERVSEQILRFGWPTGATEVEIRLGPAKSSVEDVLARTPSHRLTAAEYASQGGYALKLPWQGARVVITSCKSFGGRSFGGGSASAIYSGLLSVQYQLSRRGGLIGAPTLQVSVWTDSGRDNSGNPLVRRSPAFILVHHPTRLPLSANEQEATVLPVRMADTTGDPVARFQPTTLYNGPGVEQWETVLRDRHLRKGYYRLFLSPDGNGPSRFALLDPPLRTMKA